MRQAIFRLSARLCARNLLRAVFAYTLFQLLLVPVNAQIQEHSDRFYQKTRKFMNELQGSKYLPFETDIQSRKRRDNDLALLDSAIILCERSSQHMKDKRKHRYGELSMMTGDLFAARFEFLKAVTHYDRAIKVYQENGKEYELAIVERKLGNAHRNVGNMGKAISWLMKAHNYFIETKDSTYISALEYEIGMVHWRMEHLKKSRSHIGRALTIAKQTNDSIRMSYCYEALGLIWSTEGSFYDGKDPRFAQYHQKAIEYTIKARDLSGNAENPLLITSILINLGRYYKRLGNLPLAMDYIALSMDYAKRTNNPYATCRGLVEISQIKTEQQRYSEAEEKGLEARAISSRLENLDLEKLTLLNLTRVYHSNREFEKALDAYHEAMAKERIILNRNTLEELAGAEMNYKADKAQAEKRHAEIEVKSKNKIIDLTRELESRANYRSFALMITIIFILVLLVAGFVIYRLKVARLALKERETEVKHLKERQKLESDLESKERHTKDMAHLLAYKNEFTKKVTDEIGRVMGEQDMDQLKSQLVELKFELVRHRKSTNELGIISGNFEQIQHEFYEKIRTTCPDISKRELLVSSLIKLDIDTKQMADIVGVSDKSIRMYKYRLKKKLGLGEEIELNSYIRDL